MAEYLFPGFLDNPQSYLSAKRFWEELWERISRRMSNEAEWQHPWLTNPLPDGNPIFTAVCPHLGRGLRIIQESVPEPEEMDLDWWLDSFGDKDEAGAIRELVIACCPSAENLVLVERLLKDWIQTGVVSSPDDKSTAIPSFSPLPEFVVRNHDPPRFTFLNTSVII